MKKGKILFVAAALALVLQAVFFGACGDGTPDETTDPVTDGGASEETMPKFGYSTYDNARFSDYSENGTVGCEALPEQWEEYGAGDPYVFRFNGSYYLYVSTRDNMTGIRAWKSKDLLNWTQCGGDGLEEGYVSDDPVTKTAYAPEVYYFNGKFYMYTSPGGNGHYTLVSDSPEGPFKRITGNYGMSIDGSLFIDDDEKMYFLNASGEGIEIHPTESPDSIPEKAVTLKNTKMGWTEGPMIIKRDGIYYLTYTGVHVLSPGYRIAYGTETDGNPLADSTAFKGGADNPVLLDIDGDYNGLGHSSTVLGPNMDSYYIVYHNLHEITGHGPWRGLNIDRLLFNGTQMSVDGSAKNSIAANLPEFSADGTETGFIKSDGKFLTEKATGKVFTAEYNFSGNGVKCIAGYAGENDYCYAVCDYQGHKISLYKVTDGNCRKVAEGELIRNFDPDVLHTVRIAYADGKADVYFDNMCKIKGAEVEINAGKIGYDGGNIYCTSFSNAARGYSDRTELKQSGAKIGASSYLPQGAYEGLTSYKFSEGSGLSDYEAVYPADSAYGGAKQLKLAKENDFARYSVYFRESGTYALAITYNSNYGGKRIGIQTNLGELKKYTLPDVYCEDSEIVTATVGEFEFGSGANLVTLRSTGKEFGFISFTFKKAEKSSFEANLKEMVEDAEYCEDYKIDANGHSTEANKRYAAFFGGRYLTDGEISADIKLSDMNGKSAGLMLRAQNYANSRYDDERSLQGYYVGVYAGKIAVHKYNYNFFKLDLVSVSHSLKRGDTFNLKAVIDGNTLTVYLNGEEILYYTDPNAMVSGGFGILSDGAAVTYSNLRIESK